jgi:hypothetical protein
MQKLAVAAEEKAKEEKRNFVNGRHVKAVSHVPKCSNPTIVRSRPQRPHLN